MPTRNEREPVVGDGVGGDQTTAVDAAAEAAIVTRLAALHDEEGVDFHLVSEELGERDFGPSPELTVVVDPIDGSLNAKRTLPAYSFSFAVASGTTMADVDVGYVYDFGTDEEWAAVRGAGATLNGIPLDPTLPERRGRDGRLEVLGIESADPRWVAEVVDDLVSVVYRLRAIGSIAITLCQVAAARLDAMASLKRARAVDAAAAQLIAREGGAVFAPLDMELDVLPRAKVMAARSEETLAALAAVVR